MNRTQDPIEREERLEAWNKAFEEKSIVLFQHHKIKFDMNKIEDMYDKLKAWFDMGCMNCNGQIRVPKVYGKPNCLTCHHVPRGLELTLSAFNPYDFAEVYVLNDQVSRVTWSEP
jgi:hypothetical protein